VCIGNKSGYSRRKFGAGGPGLPKNQLRESLQKCSKKHAGPCLTQVGRGLRMRAAASALREPLIKKKKRPVVVD